jgi:hypothetical protein
MTNISELLGGPVQRVRFEGAHFEGSFRIKCEDGELIVLWANGRLISVTVVSE